LGSSGIEDAHPPLKKKDGRKVPLGPIIDCKTYEGKQKLLLWWRGVTSIEQKECCDMLKCFYDTYIISNKPKKSEAQFKFK